MDVLRMEDIAPSIAESDTRLHPEGARRGDVGGKNTGNEWVFEAAGVVRPISNITNKGANGITVAGRRKNQVRIEYRVRGSAFRGDEVRGEPAAARRLHATAHLERCIIGQPEYMVIPQYARPER